MKLHHVLVPVDFSEASQAALDYAAVIARATGADLLIVHVQEPELVYDWVDKSYSKVSKPDQSAVPGALEALRPDDRDVKCRHRLLEGDVASTLIATATAENVELIVMATHGRTGLEHLLVRSVADAVVRGVSCPVLTVRASRSTEAPMAKIHVEVPPSVQAPANRRDKAAKEKSTPLALA